MADQVDLLPVFERLKPMLDGVEGAIVTVDSEGNYCLNTPYAPKYKKELFLGAVQVKKNYVSYYLMPVYMFPDLLEGLSPALEKRMQGKSCFNFKAIDETLFGELKDLTLKSLERMRSEGLL